MSARNITFTSQYRKWDLQYLLSESTFDNLDGSSEETKQLWITSSIVEYLHNRSGKVKFKWYDTRCEELLVLDKEVNCESKPGGLVEDYKKLLLDVLGDLKTDYDRINFDTR
jgi:hypothetical protein